jgi:5-methylcytosine-specific restriction endonuclease McrA
VCHREEETARYWTDPQRYRDASGAYAKRNRAACNQKQTEWRARNREHVRAYFREQARGRRVGVGDDTLAYMDVLRRDPCAYCGGVGGGVDHVEPYIQGGANDWTNLTGCCRRCNQEKSTRGALLFLALTAWPRAEASRVA